MTSFAALMALSATQTRESEVQVQSALAERQRKEALKRKQQEEKDRKEKEMEARLRMKILEERKRDEERLKRQEAEKHAKEAAARRKEEEQRDALRYGPKRGKSDYPSSSFASKDEQRRRKSSSDDDESGAGGSVLTREEKRQLRLSRELNYGLGGHKRGGTAAGYRKAGRRLPGGAVDVSAAGGATTQGTYRSVKDRLAHEAPGLIKLNVNKRDTRTIDEIRQDLERKKSKVITGEEAKGFDDWFGTSKGKAKGTPQAAPASRATSIFSSRSPSPEDKPEPSKTQPRGTKSLSRTPPVRPAATKAQASGSASTPKTPAPKGSRVSVRPVAKPMDKMFVNKGKTTPAKAHGRLGPPVKGQPSRAPMPASKTSAASSSVPRKRQRSDSISYSESPPPHRRRSLSPDEGRGINHEISAQIWGLFGKDRSRYVNRHDLSDDEDMEADALDVLDEELRSAQIARREDEAALAEERRHEEEKRRKKKEKDLQKRG